jgi:hypothetical protein
LRIKPLNFLQILANNSYFDNAAIRLKFNGFSGFLYKKENSFYGDEGYSEIGFLMICPLKGRFMRGVPRSSQGAVILVPVKSPQCHQTVL